MFTVALMGEVGEIKLPETRRGELPHQFAGLVVGKVSARTRDALDEIRRTPARPEHHGVVVGLQRRNRRLSEFESDRIERRADVRPVEVGLAVRPEEIADGVARVVGDGERRGGERA